MISSFEIESRCCALSILAKPVCDVYPAYLVISQNLWTLSTTLPTISRSPQDSLLFESKFLYPFRRSWQIAPGVKSLNCGQRSPANLICLFRRQKTFERSVAKWGSTYAHFGSMGAYNLDRRTSSRRALVSGNYMILFMECDVYLITKTLLGR